MGAEPEVLYQDDDLLAVFKPRDWLTESGDGVESLESWVRGNLCPKAAACHRLDKATTGVVLFRKNRKWLRELSRLFEEKRARKEYWAIVEGCWPADLNRIETRIAPAGDGTWMNSKREGKLAVTTFRVLGRSTSRTWLQVLPKTGRTHQIRLHCCYAGFPISGDRLYGSDSGTTWMALHARRLDFQHPGKGERLRIESRVPDYWEHSLAEFSAE